MYVCVYAFVYTFVCRFICMNMYNATQANLLINVIYVYEHIKNAYI